MNDKLNNENINDNVSEDIKSQEAVNESDEKKDEPKKFLEEKVMNGDLGVKTGKGFYEYKKN